MVTPTLEACDFRILSDSEYNMGKTRKRHGGVIEITREEMQRMQQTYGC